MDSDPIKYVIYSEASGDKKGPYTISALRKMIRSGALYSTKYCTKQY